MKKIRSFAAIVAASLTLASCGLGTMGNTTSGTGSILGTDVLTQTGTGILGTILGNILGSTTSQQSLVGNWTYAGPKLVFESENVLSQIGGQVLSNNLEQKLGTYLEKIGFKAGKSVLTFAADGNCSLALGSKTLPGTYSYDASSNKLTLNGLFVTGQLPCTVTVQNGQLLMLFDADKLLSIATAVGSKSSSSLGSILGSYKGLKLGWAMTK
ncbi:MAG: DUF4923 family protein [Bacteroidaceae bacterium]|nr:DUF4923 family protein [Bacteroidaceae bacterium]MBQ8455253.1 DUF4923 family protein [Bacteroidaceae bacterium]MBQ9170753.1 DUF4923 family protein [Bacteroidaceae bacterium]MBQ9294738.1 DUF4923 family protein [Bacteroidaceae bacterium]